MLSVVDQIVQFLKSESLSAKPVLAYDLQTLAEDFARGAVRIDKIERRILAPSEGLHPDARQAREAFVQRLQEFLNELAKTSLSPSLLPSPPQDRSAELAQESA